MWSVTTAAAPARRAASSTLGLNVGNRLWQWTTSIRSRRTTGRPRPLLRRDQTDRSPVAEWDDSGVDDRRSRQQRHLVPAALESGASSSTTRFSPDAAPERYLEWKSGSSRVRAGYRGERCGYRGDRPSRRPRLQLQDEPEARPQDAGRRGVLAVDPHPLDEEPLVRRGDDGAIPPSGRPSPAAPRRARPSVPSSPSRFAAPGARRPSGGAPTARRTAGSRRRGRSRSIRRARARPAERRCRDRGRRAAAALILLEAGTAPGCAASRGAATRAAARARRTSAVRLRPVSRSSIGNDARTRSRRRRPPPSSSAAWPRGAVSPG